MWKTVWNFLRTLKMELPFDPAIPLLGLYPKNPETPIQQNLCTPMFIAAQFTIAKSWKQPKCPSANEWIQKLWAFSIRGLRLYFPVLEPWVAWSALFPAIRPGLSVRKCGAAGCYPPLCLPRSPPL